MEYEVRLTSKARRELHDDVAWVFQNSKSNEVAEDWYRQLIERIRTLERMPKRCPIARESRDLGVEVRQLLCGRGRNRRRVLFTIAEETVFIIGFRHCARGE